MQDIEQNMDELFRKAAENYPLKTGESNWDDIAPALLSSSVIPAESTKKRSIKKKAGLLLLLLSLSLAGWIVFNFQGNKKEITRLNKPGDEKNMTNSFNKTIIPFNKQNIEKKSATTERAHPTTQDQQLENGRILLPKKSGYRKIKYSGIKNRSRDNAQFLFTDRLFQNMPATIFKNPINDIANPKQIDPAHAISDQVIFKTAIEANDINAQKETNTENLTEKKKNSMPEQRGIYLGVASGLSFAEVKKQGFKKPGLNIGVIAGYQFNGRSSIEAGLFFAQKKYFTGGRYFNMDKIGSSMPAGMEVVSLESTSCVFEIPTRFKYNLLHKNKADLFSSAGITSYILAREKNNYLMLHNGTKQNMTGLYKNGSKYFAATLDISLGYEHTIGKSSHLRIEPYLQIPLKGIGVGSLPVLSSGLRIGLTKFIR